MKFQKKTVLALIPFIMIISSCSKNLKETRFINENAKNSFIIAGDSSIFKDSIRSRIIDKYRDRCNIEVVNINKLDDISNKDFDVILIMDTTMAWTWFNPGIKKFIEKIDKKEKIVLFMTAGDTDFKYSYKGIDAVTSASETENEEKIIKKLSERIDRSLPGISAE